MKNLVNKNQKGFTLIEILLVIGFIAGAMIIAFITYPKVQAQNRANLENQHIQAMAGGIKNLYSTAPNFDGLSVKTIVDARIAPEDMQIDKTNGKITNQWGGDITIDKTSFNGNNKFFFIQYEKVPTNECSKIASGAGASFVKVVINDTPTSTAADKVVKDYTPGVTTPLDIQPAVVATQCATSESNTVVFVSN